MSEFVGRNPFMDYRNSVPFIDLSGFVMKQPTDIDSSPAKSLKEYLFRKRFSTMINFRRLQYCKRVEEYRNGRR